jgi:hypothetical protein
MKIIALSKSGVQVGFNWVFRLFLTPIRVTLSASAVLRGDASVFMVGVFFI